MYWSSDGSKRRLFNFIINTEEKTNKILMRPFYIHSMVFSVKDLVLYIGRKKPRRKIGVVFRGNSRVSLTIYIIYMYSF